MKCPNCGAEIGSNKTCEFCGSEVTLEMKKEQEQISKQGCPKCGSSNIKFTRENQGEIRGKNAKQIVHRTVGYCQDCGHTWFPESAANSAPKKRKTWLWVLGWLFIFPVPLTILLLRKKDMKPALKYGLIAAAWIVYLIIGLSGNSNNQNSASSTSSKDTVQEAVDAEKHLYDNAEVIDLMSGSGKNKIGTMTVCHAKQSDCTEDALSDWYMNYVKVNSDSKFHVIVYDDVADKGVYANGMGFIQKDIILTKESDGTYATGDDAGSTYYTVGDDGKLSVMAVMEGEEAVNSIKEQVDAIIPDEYKNGELYAVDVAGSEGIFDCNLTLISESFADADYQKIAEELGQQIKDKDLGVGYFCIAFQSSDVKLNALSSVDNLKEQEVTEITTKVFD